MKRFYKLVSVQEGAAGFSICLDGKPVKTLGRKDLMAPTKVLAEAIIVEWAAQEEMIVPATMPLTQILSTKIDRVAVEREAMTAALMKYLNTDLLCYRTDHPPDLVSLQVKAWDPWLVWFEKRFGVGLEATTELKALEQLEAGHEKVLSFIDDLDADVFTVLQLVVPLCGSLVLGLAFVEQEIGAQGVFDAARVEEHYKAKLYDEEKHGPDPAQKEKDKEMLQDLQAAEQYLELLPAK